MKRCVNLLPLTSQYRFEHWRQARFWCTLWLLVAGALAFGQFLLFDQYQLVRRELDASQVSVAPLIGMQAEIRRLQTTMEQHRRSLESCAALEQTDTPLALLQVVSACCHELSARDPRGGIALDSLRLDETVAPPTPTGKQPIPRKGLMIVGKAASDPQVTDLVSQLRKSGAFSLVELEASQAQSDQHLSYRTFQIRCRQ